MLQVFVICDLFCCLLGRAHGCIVFRLYCCLWLCWLLVGFVFVLLFAGLCLLFCLVGSGIAILGVGLWLGCGLGWL